MSPSGYFNLQHPFNILNHGIHNVIQDRSIKKPKKLAGREVETVKRLTNMQHMIRERCRTKGCQCEQAGEQACEGQDAACAAHATRSEQNPAVEFAKGHQRQYKTSEACQHHHVRSCINNALTIAPITPRTRYPYSGLLRAHIRDDGGTGYSFCSQEEKRKGAGGESEDAVSQRCREYCGE